MPSRRAKQSSNPVQDNNENNKKMHSAGSCHYPLNR